MSRCHPAVDCQELHEAFEWLIYSDDTGLSSEALLLAALGKRPARGYGVSYEYPRDPSDLGRCLRLIHRFPWVRRGVKSLAEHDVIWQQYAKHWEEMQQLYLEEVGELHAIPHRGVRAPRLYQMMQELRRSASATGSPLEAD